MEVISQLFELVKKRRASETETFDTSLDALIHVVHCLVERSNETRRAEMDGDAVFLQFIHDRLIHMYGENEDVDYMIRLRKIIEAAK